MRSVEELEEISRQVRALTLLELHDAKSGHPGSSFSALDLMVATYFGETFRHDAQNPNWGGRDYFLLSVGHAVPGLYACLARAGYGPIEELVGLRKLGTRLAGHAHRNSYPGVESSAGSLGQGLAVGVGLCSGMRLDGKDNRVVVLTSDGEHQEGSKWESIMFAGSHQPAGLVVIVDQNHNQINGPTHSIMPVMDKLPNKYEAFGWEVLSIDGNAMIEVEPALNHALGADHPVAIIAKTTTGKGISYMEGDYHWHHGVVTDDLLLRGMSDLGVELSPTKDESWTFENVLAKS